MEALDEHGTFPREYRAYWPHTYGTLRYEECQRLPTPTLNQTPRRNASDERRRKPSMNATHFLVNVAPTASRLPEHRLVRSC